MLHFTLSGSSDITGCQCLLSFYFFVYLESVAGFKFGLKIGLKRIFYFVWTLWSKLNVCVIFYFPVHLWVKRSTFGIANNPSSRQRYVAYSPGGTSWKKRVSFAARFSRKRSSSSHVFTIPESMNLRIFLCLAFLQKIEVFNWEQKCRYNCLSYQKKDTLQ